MCLKVADDISLFTHIGPANSPPKTLSSLSTATGVPVALLKRILRHLAARHIVLDSASSPHMYSATHISEALASRDASAGIRNATRIYSPSFLELPDVLRETGYATPTNARNGIFQRKHGLQGLTMFECLQRPENKAMLEDFSLLMKYTTKGGRSFLDVCDIATLISRTTEGEGDMAKGRRGADEGYVFVDIGGGTGTDVHEFRSRFPHVKGRVELQELGGVIANIQQQKQAGVLQSAGVKLRTYDFFTPQPVRSARFYFMGSVLHDWPDEDAKRILKNVATAMEPGYSTLLLSENVLPDAGCHPHLSAIDLTMATILAGKERSEEDWRALLGTEGLRIVKVHTIPSCLKSVLECELV